MADPDPLAADAAIPTSPPAPEEHSRPPATSGAPDPIKCAVKDCGTRVVARGLCTLHYQRLMTHGDVLVALKKRTSNGAPMAFLVALPCDGYGCVAWPYAKDSTGYGRVYSRGQMRNASRVVCEHIHGEPPTPAHQAAHSCGRGHTGCVAPWHLNWASPAKNQFDRIVHRTDGRGERNAQAKLTLVQVAEIRLLAGTATQKRIGARYGISHSAVSAIMRGKRWSAA